MMDSEQPRFDFLGLELKLVYRGTSSVLREFLQPVLQRSVTYDRLTSFFNVESLLSISEGIENLWRQRGTMRLVMGIHDVPREILDAYQLRERADLVEALEARLLTEVSSLQSEMEKNRIVAIAWLMKAGLLQIRVAQPISVNPAHIFHSKLIILNDSYGNTLSATGSPNETRPGFDGNYEDLTVHKSWVLTNESNGRNEYVEEHVNHFNTIWEDMDPDLNVYSFDDDFVEALMEAAGGTFDVLPRIFLDESALERFLQAVNSSPNLGHLCLKSAVLYPHQERALRDGLNRWPIRVMLADEVGLGKTLEAGSIINHVVRYQGISDVCVLAPASLLKQFQEELQTFFGLNFYIWDSSTTSYRDSDWNSFENRKFNHPLEDGRPKFVIISSQLARGSKTRPSIFEKCETLPEMLVVDEAHAARVRTDVNGSRPTRLWRALDEVKSNIPHLLLLTATPIQLDPLEFHGLLRLIGLPETWSTPRNYLRSLDFLGGRVSKPTLQDAQLLVKMLVETIKLINVDYNQLSSSELKILQSILDESGLSNATASVFAHKRWNECVSLLSRFHPAHGLVIRNTRTGLEKFGYKFPSRKFSSPNLILPQALSKFFEDLDEYLDAAYGLVEEAANPQYRNSKGFAKVGYQQRLASSLNAAKLSLVRRLEKISAVEAGKAYSEAIDEIHDEVDEEDFDASEFLDIEIRTEPLPVTVQHAIQVERGYIKGLLNQLQKVAVDIVSGDPKYQSALSEIEQFLGRERVLVFSKFTDTLDGLFKLIQTDFPEICSAGIGMYTGKEAWIEISGVRSRVTKNGLKEALDAEQIRLVLCSDAASEGLNLQSARRLINLDVPWNPARLEQRIGRIARLGQKSENVFITNLWYPNSVEGRMYQRLLERSELFELAVGQFPEIVGKAIRNSVRAGGSSIDSGFELDALAELEESRLNVQLAALSRVWNIQETNQSISSQILQDLAAFFETINLGKSNEFTPITFGNLQSSKLTAANQIRKLRRQSLYCLKENNLVWGFVVVTENSYYLIREESLVPLLKSILGGSELSESDCYPPMSDQKEFVGWASSVVSESYPGPRDTEIRFAEFEKSRRTGSRASSQLFLERLCEVDWRDG